MKKMIVLGGVALLIAVAVVSLIVLRGDAEPDDEHAGHDHGAPAHHEEDKSGISDHPVHDDETEGHEADGEEGSDHIELTAEQRKRIDLEIVAAGPGTIVTEATFPGETILNPDRMVHVVPRAAGIVREAMKTLGDRVEAGETLAWIESHELAEAKLSFYAKQTEVGCCMIELPRAREIFDNTAKLLALLKKEATQEELHKLDGLEMGEYRGRLLTAYAEYLAARETCERERNLRTKEIASGQELLEAETAFKKAREEFRAAMDMARYETLIAYGEAVQKRQVAEFEAVAAEKRLRLKGADDEVVARLLELVPKTAGLKPCLCDDPDCEDDKLPSVVETLGKDKRFAWYPVRAPFAGFVTERHLTLGEEVNGDESVFTIADTSSVWVNFNVYQKDLASVKSGQVVRIALGAAGHREGTIAYLSPVIDKQTRTVQARVVLDNRDGTLRPGLYVTVRVTSQTEDAPVVIPKSAVQVLGEREVVFVEDGDGFEAVRVELGAADRERVVVTSGLLPGQRYVARGAFDLKARVVSSGMRAHAGHGH